MRLRHVSAIALALGLGTATAFAGGACDWTLFNDETSQRLNVAANIGADDTEEKDYAWADLDKDGDVDLVIVRKTPFSNVGPRRNVLLMNEGGVLVDRTSEYASASDVGGDQGFLTPTDDRDVVLVDVDGDTWLDMVTAVTYGEDLPRHLSHPRVYMNLGNDGRGNWQGFLYEEARIPQIAGGNGNFCAVTFGDVDNNGSPDLYFSDYDVGGGTPNSSVEDLLMVNDGNGFFTDVSNTAFSGNTDFLSSTFTAHSEIVDINHDGFNDIIKVSALGPYNLKTAYNNPANPGVFTCGNVDVNCGVADPPCEAQGPYSCTDYFITMGDLNNDGKTDMVISDDGFDKVFLNQGNGGDGFANFSNTSLPNSNDFNGNSVIADLNNDGFNDIVVTDVDVDLFGCDRITRIYRNNGNLPNVTFTEDNAGIPLGNTSGRRAGHDVAIFDIDGDGFLDIVLGTCFETSVWMNDPPASLEFDYPSGQPAVVTPGLGATFDVTITPNCQAKISAAEIFISVNGGGFTPSALAFLGGNDYQATLPAEVVCGDHIDYYLSATAGGGDTFVDPPNAPSEVYEAEAADSVTVSIDDTLEGDVSGWTVVNDPSLSRGGWEHADPNGTISGGGLAQPEDDATPDPGTMAFITENCTGADCDAAGITDVDGGPTDLISPTIDLSAASDARISFARWHYNSTAGAPEEDFLEVAISDDNGGSWVAVSELDTNDTGRAWETVNFLVTDYITPTAQVRVRFRVDDSPNDSITESGIDDFKVEELNCDGPPCPWDLNGDGSIATADLLDLLSAWGPNPGHPADFNGDDSVGTSDLLDMLGHWGDCP